MLKYCDYIAYTILKCLKDHKYMNSRETYLGDLLGPVKMDLHPTEGYFLSTKKTIIVNDINGQKYRITVEEYNDSED